MKNYRILLCFIFLFLIQQAYSLQPRFRHYTVENGLSSNAIQCLLQDKNGFIWCGTSDGLNRFDAKISFFTNITHEIRTPVSLILAPVEEIMRHKNIPEEIRDDLEVVKRNSERLLDLINQILDFTKAEQEAFSSHNTQFNICDFVKKSAMRFTPYAQQKGIQLNTQYPGHPVHICTDREALTQILSNLLTNALKFTNNQIDIHIHENPDIHSITLSVEDNGIGIKPSEKEKIFNLFYQIDDKSKLPSKGFGIGLAIVSLLVKRMMGTIEVESEENKFARFRVTLPVNEQESLENLGQEINPYIPGSDHPSSTSGTEENTTAEGGRNDVPDLMDKKAGTVLIVEDNEEFVSYMTRIIGQKYHIHTAENGEEALKLLEDLKPDIIISDIMMPVMDGTELCKRIKKDIRLSHIPVILLTARTDTDTKIAGLENGADVYIERRNRLKREIGQGVLLFLGNNECGMNYADNTYHFRQDSTFLYFFGSDYTGLSAIIDIDENREIIFGDELTIDDIVWMGTQPSIREKSAKVGITETAPTGRLATYLQDTRKQGRKIHYLPPYRTEHQVTLFQLLNIPVSEQSTGASTEFIRAVVNQRNYKSEEEIQEIEKAVDVSVSMHMKAMQIVRPSMKESEITAAVTEIALSSGGQLSFPVITTINGQTLHNHYHGNTLQEGQMLLLDAGAESNMHYSGDLSSTMPVGKHFTEQQKIIYNIALHAHQSAVNALKPGIPFRDVHLIAATAIAEGMKSLGLMKGDPVEAAQSGAYALFFPCGLGHMMGMDVHDMENLGEVWVGYNGQPKSKQFGFKSLRLARPLEPGFVFTIEPGIYFIPELIDYWKNEKRFSEFINYDKLENWKGFSGIRNEEDYLITADGARRLGKYKPMTIEEVESMK